MCTSVPQIAVLSTRIRTFPAPAGGTETSLSVSPGPRSSLTSASMVFIRSLAKTTGPPRTERLMIRANPSLQASHCKSTIDDAGVDASAVSSANAAAVRQPRAMTSTDLPTREHRLRALVALHACCLLYTSDAADDLHCVDL